MKNLIGKFVIVFLILTSAAQISDAQIIVRVRPVRPAIVRIAAPAPNYVWVDEDWVWQNNNYVYTGGRWIAPPSGRAVWVPGHWKNTPRRGWIWKPGHWR